MKNLNVNQSNPNWLEVHFDKAQTDKKHLTAYMQVNFNINGVQGTKYIAIENIPVGNDKALKEANRKLGTMLEKSLNAYLSKHHDLGSLHYKVFNSKGSTIIDKNLKGKLSAKIRSYLPGNINKLTKDIGLMFKTAGYQFGQKAPWIHSPSPAPSSHMPSRPPTDMPSRPPVETHPTHPQPKQAKVGRPQKEKSGSGDRIPSRHPSTHPRVPSSRPQVQPQVQQERVPSSRPQVQPQAQQERVPSSRPQVQPQAQQERAPSSRPTVGKKAEATPPRRFENRKSDLSPHVASKNEKSSDAIKNRQSLGGKVQSEKRVFERPVTKPSIQEKVPSNRRSVEAKAEQRLSSGQSNRRSFVEESNYDQRMGSHTSKELESFQNLQDRVEELFGSVTIKNESLEAEIPEIQNHSFIVEAAEDYPIESEVFASSLEEIAMPLDYSRELFELLESLPEDERNIMLDLREQFNIPDESILKIYDDRFIKGNQRGTFLNTLKSIVEFDFGDKAKRYRKQGPNTFGWSTTDDGLIFIRMDFKGEGTFMKASSALCVNNMKEYINLSPRKGQVAEQAGIPKEQINRKQKAAVFGQSEFQTLNQVKIKEARTKELLHNLGIPHIVPMHLVSYTSKTKNVGLKTSYIVEKSEDLYHAKIKPLTDSYYDGNPLQGLPLDDFNLLIENTFDSLRHLHGNNYSHNDLKPDNFIMSQDGGVNLADFDGLTLGNGTEIVTATTKLYWSSEYVINEEEFQRAVEEEEQLAIQEGREAQAMSLDLYGTTQNDAYAMGVMYTELLFGSPNPVEIFMDNNNDLANKWQNIFYAQDVDKINARSISDAEKRAMRAELDDQYTNGNYEVHLGDRLRTRELLEEFVIDLETELNSRGIFPGPELNNFALLTIRGLLDPDPANRMTMEQAYNDHIELMNILDTY